MWLIYGKVGFFLHFLKILAPWQTDSFDRLRKSQCCANPIASWFVHYLFVFQVHSYTWLIIDLFVVFIAHYLFDIFINFIPLFISFPFFKFFKIDEISFNYFSRQSNLAYNSDNLLIFYILSWQLSAH